MTKMMYKINKTFSLKEKNHKSSKNLEGVRDKMDMECTKIKMLTGGILAQSQKQKLVFLVDSELSSMMARCIVFITR